MKLPLLVVASPSSKLQSPEVLLRKGTWIIEHTAVDTVFDLCVFDGIERGDRGLIVDINDRIEVNGTPKHIKLITKKMGTEKSISAWVVKCQE